MTSRLRFDLKTAFYWLTLVAVWLGAVHFALRFKVPLEYVAFVTVTVVAIWHQRRLTAWQTWLFAILWWAVLVYMLMPRVY